MTADTQLDETQIRIALAYRNSYPDEIDEAIADNRRSVDDLAAVFASGWRRDVTMPAAS